MKKLGFTTLLLLNLTVMCFGQKSDKTKEGVIYFEEKINMHRRIQDPDMRAQIPEFRTTEMQLTFKDTESLYETAPQDDEAASSESGGGGPRIMMIRGLSSIIHRNLGTSIVTEQRDMMDSTFLIVDSVKKKNWVLVDSTKKILNYTCQLATLTDTTLFRSPIEAWYTKEIALASGPQSAYGLDGMILQLDINKGDMIVTAKTIEFRRIKAADVKVPTKGTRITRAEFNDRVKAMMKKMGRNNGVRIMKIGGN